MLESKSLPWACYRGISIRAWLGQQFIVESHDVKDTNPLKSNCYLHDVLPNLMLQSAAPRARTTLQSQVYMQMQRE